MTAALRTMRRVRFHPWKPVAGEECTLAIPPYVFRREY